MNSLESGIDAGRLIFKNLWIEEWLDEFINNLSLYQYEWDDKLWQFKKVPIHDFTSHDADWFRYMATTYNILIRGDSKEIAQEHTMELHPYSYKKEEVAFEFEIEDSAY